MKAQPKATTVKEMVFTIEYRVDLEDAGAIGEVMDKMREQGSAEIVDAKVAQRQLHP